MVGTVVLERLVGVVLAIGPPVLFVLFYADGLIVGKLLQPAAVFVAFVGITHPSWPILIGVSVGCIVAATAGQWTLYRGCNPDAPEYIGLRRKVQLVGEFPDRVIEHAGERQMAIVERGFDRFGTVGICALNLIPGIRGLSAIPAGLSGFPRSRFVVAATLGNAGYVTLLGTAGLGLVRVIGIVS